jgi:iron complex outermembrane recepter protein
MQLSSKLWAVFCGVAAVVGAGEPSNPTPPATPRIGEVLVTGVNEKERPSKLPEPSLTVPTIEAAREVIERTAGGANVVDAEEYKKGRASTLVDALGYSPGVFVQSRFGAEEARISIRGSGLQRTFHGRGIKLMQDGVPVNLADGGFDFQAIEPLATRYIEVFRGANALQYGSSSLGGSVNFVSPTGYDADKVQVRTEAGSYGYVKAQVSSGQVIGKADYYISGTHFQQDGFRDHSTQNNQRGFANVGWRASKDIETRFYLTYVKTESELPGSLTKAILEDEPKDANPGNQTGDQKRDFDLARIANKTTVRLSDHERIQVGTYYSYKDLFHPIFQVIDQVTNDVGLDFKFTSDRDVAGRKNFLAVGINPSYGTAKDNRFVNSGGQPAARTGKSDQESVNLELYADNQHYILDNVAIVGGFQASYNTRKFDDRFPPTVADPDNSDKQEFFGFSPKLGLRYEFLKTAQAYFNVSRSYEPPSFGELVGSRDGGLVELDAQRATTVEVGTRGDFAKLNWDVSYYYAWLEDELLSLNDPDGNPLGTVNAKKTIHQGFEVGLGYSIWEGLAAKDPKYASGNDRITVRASYAWNDFRFDDDSVYGDNELAGVPEHVLRAELRYEHPNGFYAGPNVEWAPQRVFVDHQNTFSADPYAILGFRMGYKLPKNVSIFFDARNLTDKKYAATTGVISNANGNDTRQFLPGDERSFYVGVEWKW